MKLRNQLLALCCLLAFGAFGFLYVTHWVVQKPFGIILFVSDGLVARQLTAARLYEGGADHRLAIEDLPRMALLRNSAAEFAVPDAAAAATALATGAKVKHRILAVGPDGQNLPTILDLARAQGRTVGLVTNGALTAPGISAFYAHTSDARDVSGIATQLLNTGSFKVVLGGGAGEFLPAAKGGRRIDGRDLLGELQAGGRDLVRTRAELEDAAAYRDKGLVGVFSPNQMAYGNQIDAAKEQPSLADMVRRAIECLQSNRLGYVLVVDAALVSTAAEHNDGEHVITETLVLDRAIDTARRYAGGKALILATARHATGGMSLNGYPLRDDHGVALLGANASGQPAITWATGPNGPSVPLPAPGAPSASASTPAPAATAAGARSEPAAFQTLSALNTAEDVMAVGIGPGSENLHGFLENTEIFKLILDAL